MTTESSTAEFRDRVREWVTIDNQLKAASYDIKSLRQRSYELKEWIMDFMEDQDIDVSNILNKTQTLRVLHREAAIKPRKEEVISKMGEFLKASGVTATGGDLYKFVYEDNVERRKARNLSRRKKGEPRPLKKRKTEATIDELLPTVEEDEEGLGTI